MQDAIAVVVLIVVACFFAYFKFPKVKAFVDAKLGKAPEAPKEPKVKKDKPAA